MILRVILGIAAVAFVAGNASARDLSDQIISLFGERGVEADVDRNAIPHRAHFGTPRLDAQGNVVGVGSLATFGILLGELSSQAADFPATSTVPGFTYRFNERLEVFERTSSNLGSAFVERARTLGRGKLDVGLAYLFVDFDELDGEDLDSLTLPGITHNDCCAAPPSPGNPAFEQDTSDVFFEKFELVSHVFSLFATYGITDRLDVNLLLPVVYTSLDVRATADFNDESGTRTHFFDTEAGTTSETRSVDDDAFGVGDLQLRTKFHAVEGEAFNVATGLGLRVPTGNEDDFQGIGDVTLTPFLAATHEIGPVEFRATGGLEINFDDSDRSRIRYGGGVSYQLIERVAVFADVIGSSNLKTDRVGVTVPVFVNAPGTSEATPTTIPSEVRVFQEVSTDIVDVAPGMKVALSDSAVAFFQVFLPVNDDGLRADFIPAGGVEISF